MNSNELSAALHKNNETTLNNVKASNPSRKNNNESISLNSANKHSEEPKEIVSGEQKTTTIETTGNNQQFERVIILYIISQRGRAFSGPNLIPLLEDLSFSYGEHGIYHRHLDVSHTSPIIYSVANMLKPGTFPIENIADFKTTGLTLFMSCPSEAGTDVVNFRMMLKAAKTLSRELDGFILDDKRQDFTDESEQVYLTKIKS